MSLGLILGILLLGAIAVFLVNRAPFIDAPWKSYISYFILVVVVLAIVGGIFGGFGQLTNIRIGKQ